MFANVVYIFKINKCFKEDVFELFIYGSVVVHLVVADQICTE